MQLTNQPQRSPAAAHQAVGDEAVLINLNTGSYYTLNEIGALFWDMLNGQRSISDCAQLVVQEYEVDLAVVEADLLELAVDFQREGLIVV